MLLACIYLIFFGTSEGGFFYLILGIVGTLYFVYALVMALVAASKTRAILTIDPEGITDSQLQGAAGFLRYEDICEAKALRRMKESYLGIVPKDPDSFLEGLSGSARAAAKANMNLNLPPVLIRMEDAVEMTADMAADIIEEHLSSDKSEVNA